MVSEATPPPIWMISLTRATERRAFVEAGFRELGIPYEIVDAVDGSAVTSDDRRAASQTRALLHQGRRLTEGTLGNALSHLSVYRRMLDEGLSSVVVMEDDAIPTPDLSAVLDAVGSFPPDWDVVTFCTQFAWAGPTPIDDRELAGHYRLCTYQRLPYGAQCYLVRDRAARRLLDVGFPVALPADDLLFRRHPAALTVYGVEPRLVVDGGFRSELVDRGRVVDLGRFPPRVLDPAIVVAGKVWRRVQRARDGRTRGSGAGATTAE